MYPLRNAKQLARFVLVWFALSIGVAIASPMVQPQGLQLVCSGSGSLKVVVVGDEGQASPLSHTLDCPLCASFAAPPVAETVGIGGSNSRLSLVSIRLNPPATGHQAAPPPARAPPAYSLNA